MPTPLRFEREDEQSCSTCDGDGADNTDPTPATEPDVATQPGTYSGQRVSQHTSGNKCLVRVYVVFSLGRGTARSVYNSSIVKVTGFLRTTDWEPKVVDKTLEPTRRHSFLLPL